MRGKTVLYSLKTVPPALRLDRHSLRSDSSSSPASLAGTRGRSRPRGRCGGACTRARSPRVPRTLAPRNRRPCARPAAASPPPPRAVLSGALETYVSGFFTHGWFLSHDHILKRRGDTGKFSGKPPPTKFTFLEMTVRGIAWFIIPYHLLFLTTLLLIPFLYFVFRYPRHPKTLPLYRPRDKRTRQTNIKQCPHPHWLQLTNSFGNSVKSPSPNDNHQTNILTTVIIFHFHN